MVTLLDVVAPLVEVGEGRGAPACVRGRRRRSWPRGLQREASPDPQSRQEHHRGERERASGLTVERLGSPQRERLCSRREVRRVGEERCVFVRTF